MFSSMRCAAASLGTKKAMHTTHVLADGSSFGCAKSGVISACQKAGSMLVPPVDDIGDEGRVMLGYEDVASVEIGVVWERS